MDDGSFKNNFNVVKDCPGFSYNMKEFLSEKLPIKSTFNEEPKPAKKHSHTLRDKKIIFKDEDVSRFLNLNDSISLFSKHPCLCQSIIRAFALSMNVLIPLIKMSVNVTTGDLEFLDHICSHMRKVQIFESHADFCSIMGIKDFINRLVDPRSILNIFHVNTLNTYYCGHCKYQKTTRSDNSPLILESPCSHASPETVRQPWFCPNCFSSQDSYIESKIIIPKKSTAFVLFTFKGITSFANVLDQQNQECELQSVPLGKFVAKYFLVHESNGLSYFESYKGKWRGTRFINFASKYSYYDSPPFLSINIRAIIWHHSSPSVVAQSLLTVESIKSNFVSLNSETSPSNKNPDIFRSLPLFVAPQCTNQSISYNENNHVNPLKRHTELNNTITKLKPTDENTPNFIQDVNSTKDINDFPSYNGDFRFQ